MLYGTIDSHLKAINLGPYFTPLPKVNFRCKKLDIKNKQINKMNPWKIVLFKEKLTQP